VNESPKQKNAAMYKGEGEREDATAKGVASPTGSSFQ